MSRSPRRSKLRSFRAHSLQEPNSPASALASDLGVSVITTKRAYADLEQLGFICTVQGKGCFVAEGNQELLRENQLCHIEELLAQAATQAETLGVTRDKLHEMLDLVAPETMQ